jgi:hypothetical protein
MTAMLREVAVIAVTKPDALTDGDQAIDERAPTRSADLTQLAGHYSRFGRSHPGPSWTAGEMPELQPIGPTQDRYLFLKHLPGGEW